MRRVMLRYFDEVRTVLERHGGTVEKFIGDAVMAVFGVPVVHEDDALRAVRAADEMRRALARLNDELDERFGVRLEERIGINTGEVVVGDPTTAADDRHRRRRQRRSAPPAGGAAGRDPPRPGDAPPRRRPRPRRPARVVLAQGQERAGQQLAPRRGARGRGADLPAPRLAARRARARARPPARRLSRRARGAVVPARDGSRRGRRRQDAARAGGGGPFVRRDGRAGPLPLLRRGDHVLPRDRDRAEPRRPRLRTTPRRSSQARIAQLLPPGDESALVTERLVGLLSADADVRAEEVFWAVRKLLEAVARSRPLVLVLEDLHWAEPTLLDLVEYLVGWSRGAPMLVLALARPDLLEVRPGWPGEHLFLEPLGGRRVARAAREPARHRRAGRRDRPPHRARRRGKPALRRGARAHARRRRRARPRRRTLGRTRRRRAADPAVDQRAARGAARRPRSRGADGAAVAHP